MLDSQLKTNIMFEKDWGNGGEWTGTADIRKAELLAVGMAGKAISILTWNGQLKSGVFHSPGFSDEEGP